MLRLSQERQQRLECENEALQQRLRKGEPSKPSQPSQPSRLSPSRSRHSCETSTSGSGSTSSGMPYRSGSPNALARRNRPLQPSKSETGTSLRTKAASRPRSPLLSPKTCLRGLRSSDPVPVSGTVAPDAGRRCTVRPPEQIQRHWEDQATKQALSVTSTTVTSASSSCCTPTVITAADLAAMEAGQEHSCAVAAAVAFGVSPGPSEPRRQPHAVSVRVAHGTAVAPQSRAAKLQRRPGLVPLSGAASNGATAASASQDPTQRRHTSPTTVWVATMARPRSTGPSVAGSVRGSGPNGSPGPASASLRRLPGHGLQPTQGSRRTSTEGRRCPPSPTRGSLHRRSLPSQRVPSPGAAQR